MASDPRIVGITPGGSEQVVYDSPASEPEFTAEPCCYLEEISAHVERHLGPVASVIHEIVSQTVHVDILVVAPTADRDFWTFVTAGMSHLRMHLPDGVDAKLGRAELVAGLPTDRFARALRVRRRSPRGLPGQLAGMARALPARTRHLVGTGPHDADRPADRPGHAHERLPVRGYGARPAGFGELDLADGERINFYAVLPLHEDEMAFKLDRGAAHLLERMDDVGVTEIFDAARPSVFAKRPSALGGLLAKVWPPAWRH
jgi:hypothetical protein